MAEIKEKKKLKKKDKAKSNESKGEKTEKKKRKKAQRRSQLEKIGAKFSKFGKSKTDTIKANYLIRITDKQAIVTLEGQLLNQDASGIVLRHKKGRGTILRISRIPASNLVYCSGSVGEACAAVVRRSKLIAEFYGTVETSKSGKTCTIVNAETEETTVVNLEQQDRFDIEIFVDEGSSRKSKKEGKGKGKKDDVGEDDFED